MSEWIKEQRESERGRVGVARAPWPAGEAHAGGRQVQKETNWRPSFSLHRDPMWLAQSS